MFCGFKFGEYRYEEGFPTGEQQHHEEFVKGITEQLKPIMAKSTQAIFVYLDDTHKACNKQYADLLGYKSAKEWADIDAPLADVKEKDQPKVISAYEKAMQTRSARVSTSPLRTPRQVTRQVS